MNILSFFSYCTRSDQIAEIELSGYFAFLFWIFYLIFEQMNASPIPKVGRRVLSFLFFPEIWTGIETGQS